MNIITVTFSPAIDVHCHADSFITERENFAEISSRESGGKGINISRALCSCGIKNTAIVAVGEENADAFLAALRADGITYDAIRTSGAIRENITIHPEGVKETRLSFSGFLGDKTLVEDIESAVNGITESGDIVAIAGSIPKGVDVEWVKAFALRLKAKGIRVIIDSRSFTPEDIMECAPFLIKPNEEEIVAYTKTEISLPSDAIKAAKLIRGNGVENVMISLGARGAALACENGAFFAEPPKIEALSTVGAGDSSIAGFIAGLSKKASAAECLMSAVAFGSAACLREGTKPPLEADIAEIFKKIELYVF